MKSNNPPRRVEIRGQDHLLAYITPAEAQLLMDNGGSGEPGPMGIPAYRTGPGDMGGSAGSDSGDNGGNGGGGGGFGGGGFGEGQGGDGMGGNMGGRSGPTGGRGGGRASAGMDTARGGPAGGGGMSPGESQARYGTPAFAGRTTAPSAAEVDAVGRAPSSERGFDVTTAKAITDIMMSPELGWVDRAALEAYAKGKNMRGFTPAPPGYPGVFSSFQAEQSMPPGLLSAAFDMFGLPTTGFVTTGWGEGVMGDGPEGDGPSREIVPTQTNPVTGQEECPSGYTFDGEINACRIDAPLANVGDTVGGTTVGGDGFTYEPGTYARMGLLDVAPQGLPEFAERYGAGFMTPEEFEAANLDYRRRAGTMAGIFQDPYNLQGYTLLS